MKRLLLGVAMVALCSPAFAAKPTNQLSAGDTTAVEGQPAQVPVTKTGSGSAKFTYSILPGTADDTDYTPQSGMVSITESMVIPVPTTKDNKVEGPETFIVRIQAANNNTTVTKADATITITDSGDVTPPTPIDCGGGVFVTPPATCPVPPTPITCWDGSTVTPPAVCPPVGTTPPPSGNIPVDGIWGVNPITSIDPMLGTKPAGIPGTMAPDPVGAFRFTCGFAGLGRFDPKVRPGDVTGLSHGHQFYGNTHITPFSDYPTLRTTGPSTCSYGPYPVNRTAYWQPWLEDGLGHVLQPDYVTVYYKREPVDAPGCAPGPAPNYHSLLGCVRMPHGLFFIFGYDFLTQTTPTGAFDFTCQVPPNGVVNVFHNLAEAAASGKCGAGNKFSSRGTAPKCWNGTQVDSVNHRSHMAPMKRDVYTGKSSCPTTHPYIIPTITLLTTWTIPAGSADLSLWHFSSDYMRPDMPPGYTFHVDIFQAWEPGVHTMWHDGCIDQQLNCSSGNTGIGRMINMASVPFYPPVGGGAPVSSWTNPMAVVPMPGPTEALDALWGPSYGRAAPNWASTVPTSAKTLKEPRYVRVLQEAFERRMQEEEGGVVTHWKDYTGERGR